MDAGRCGRLTKRGSWRRVALLCPSTGRPQRDGDVLGSRRQLLVADAKTVPEEEPPEEELFGTVKNIKKYMLTTETNMEKTTYQVKKGW